MPKYLYFAKYFIGTCKYILKPKRLIIIFKICMFTKNLILGPIISCYEN